MVKKIRHGFESCLRQFSFCMYLLWIKGNVQFLVDISNFLLGLKPFVCTMCNESFSRRHTLNKHIRGAHGTENKPFQCSSCSKTFKSTTKLEHHFARFHELRNVQSCPHCGKLYSRSKGVTKLSDLHNYYNIHVCLSVLSVSVCPVMPHFQLLQRITKYH